MVKMQKKTWMVRTWEAFAWTSNGQKEVEDSTPKKPKEEAEAGLILQEETGGTLAKEPLLNIVEKKAGATTSQFPKMKTMKSTMKNWKKRNTVKAWQNT